jgi:OOP family OmpA-OmpF porin
MMQSILVYRVFVAVVAGAALWLPAAAMAEPPVEIAQAPAAGDVAGSKDPVFLKRYEGSKIIAYLTQSYDRYVVGVPDPANPSGKNATVEGQITRIVYLTGPDHTPLELLRNYESAIEEAGLTRSLEVTSPSAQEAEPRGFACGTYRQSWQPKDDWYDLSCAGIKQMGYVSARGNKDGKDITLAVMVVNFKDDRDMTYQGRKQHLLQSQVTVVVDVVAAKAVEIKMVEVKASDIADALASAGKIDLYGILFDVDKTEIKPESTKTLDEVASLLKIDRALKLEISGHTDNTGDKDHNQKLSEGRAQAVVDTLVKKYGIDAARLQAKGYGDTKPLVANDTDANKAKNRRVELRKVS